jgi:hypothetical protein
MTCTSKAGGRKLPRDASLCTNNCEFMLLKIRFLLVLSLAVISSLTANAKPSALPTVNPAITSAHSSADENTLDLRDFGAVGDGVADDGPALQAALDALADAGGGALLVPAGRYALVTPVAKDFSGISNIAIIGAEPPPDSGLGGLGRELGLLSEFIVQVGQTNIALSISGVKNFLIQDITFIGDPNVQIDCQSTLSLLEVESAIVRHCEFYGLAAIVPDGTIVYANHSNLTIEDSAFLGCSTATNSFSAVVQSVNWRGITITGTRFIDYGNRGNFFSKTPLSPPNSWISIGNAAAADATSSRREVVLRDLFLDEGVYIGISCIPSFFSSVNTPINLIFISGIQMNVNNLESGGIFLSRVERVLIEKSYLGWSHNADSAIHLVGVGEAIIDQVECAAHAYRIRADATTNRVTVVNSIYEYLDSLAQVTEVVNTDSLSDDPVQYVRQQYLDILGREPDPSGFFYWARRLLRCKEDAGCTAQTRAELAEYLGGNPSPTFTLSGQVAESDGRLISGATVTLSGSASWVAQTDENGNYSFPNLPTGGSYTVMVARKNYIFDQPSQLITAPIGNRTVDFLGTMVTYSITGRVANPSGKGIAGAVMVLSGSQDATDTTDSNGDYRFDDVRAEGAYLITVERANYDFTPQEKSINGLTANLSVNFTGIVHKYTISGDINLSGVDVTLSGAASATMRTGTNGTYSFTVDAEGDYTLTASKTHYTFTPASYTFFNVVAHKTLNFVPKLNTHVISGSTGLSGVTVTLGGGSAGTLTTGADGKYSFTVNAGGSYTVTASKVHYTFTPPSYSYTDLSGNQTANFAPLLNTHTISGSTGLSGVSITLSGGATGTITTGADGKYSFTVNAGGNYAITPARANYTFAPLSRSFTNLSGNQIADFVGTLNTYVISGSCGLQGVEVRLQGGSSAMVTTGADGKYSFTVNGNGSYTVTASKAHYTFAPPSYSFTNLSGNQTANFTAQLNTYTISGSTGLEGVKVSLGGDATANVTTSANGLYSFTVNALGNYTITADKTDYVFTPQSYSLTALASNQVANFAGAPVPRLLLEMNSDLAIALTTVNLLRGPFSIINTQNFSADQRTRLMLFAANTELKPNETSSVVTAQAEDSQQKVYPLTVEYVGGVDSLTHLTQINIKLSDELSNLGDVWVSIKVRGITSNKARIRIVSTGSGAP